MNRAGKSISVYVYYKIQSADLNDVLAKASIFWQAVRLTGITLQLETLIKRDQSSEVKTLMEHYAVMPADADMVIKQIRTLAESHHMPEPRHVEIFTAISA